MLRQRRRIDDPWSLERLSDTVPDTNDEPELEFYYHVPRRSEGTEDYVHCAYCGYPTHLRGYVLRYPDGTRVLIGCECGPKHFGVGEFRVVERAFKDDTARQYSLRRLEAAREVLPAVLRELWQASQHEAPALYRTARIQFSRALPDLYRRLAAAAVHHGGALTVEERVRDRAAEDRRANRRDAEGRKTSPIYRTFEKEVWQIEGAELFRPSSPGEMLVEVHGELREINRDLARNVTTGRSNRELLALRQRIVRLIEQAKNILVVLDAPRRFFKPQNILEVVEWANRRGDVNGPYRADGARIVRAGHGTSDTEECATVPAGYEVPAVPSLGHLRSALADGQVWDDGCPDAT